MTDQQETFEVEVVTSHVATCSCGWTSIDYDEENRAETAGQIHVEEAHDA